MIRTAVILCLLYTTLNASWGGGGGSHKRVQIRDVTSLTLKDGEYTTGRRSSPVPQLQCSGSHCSSNVRPRTVQCKQVGFDGVDAQWKCEANLEHGYSFDMLDVSCEGYEYPDDPYILAGSCGLKYSLKSKHGGSGWGSSWSQSHTDKSERSLMDLMVFVGALVVLYFVVSTCFGSRSRDPSTGGGTGGGGGGGGGGPPPYGWGPGNGGGGSGGGRPGGGPPPSYDEYDDCSQSRRRTQNAAPGGSNFWTGLGLGGLAGYMMGGGGARRRGYGGYGGYGGGYGGYGGGYGGYGGGGSSFFGGGGGGGSSASSSSGYASTSRR